jgi:hypothetical protein
VCDVCLAADRAEQAAAFVAACFQATVDITQFPPAGDTFFPFENFAKNHAVTQQ